MFKALHIQNNTEVVIIDPKWQQDIESLRTMDRQNNLVCQGCREPVRVRAGEERRYHFAHKHLLNCTYSDESAALREARAVLYEWLSSKFGDRVTIEKKVNGYDLFRPVDCWVEKDNKTFAYWIFDTGLGPDKREQIMECFCDQKIRVNFVFLSEMLRKDTDHSSSIHLTTTERDFMCHSLYDEGHNSTNGQSLHYLDTQQHTISTYRGLHLIHRPQVFQGVELSNDLAQIQVSPKNGEFVHPGEHERLRQYQEEKAAIEKGRNEARERRHLLLSSFQEPSKRSSASPMASPAIPVTENRKSFSHPTEKAGICIFCGVYTTDWWTHDGNTGQCKCKSCLREGKW